MKQSSLKTKDYIIKIVKYFLKLRNVPTYAILYVLMFCFFLSFPSFLL